MSTAHRPTWNPTEGRADNRHMTRRVAAQELPAHTKLKFRQPQQGGMGGGAAGGSSSSSSGTTALQASRDIQHRRDLKRELEAAERANRNSKRREQGLAPEEEAGEDSAHQTQQRQAIEGAPADGRGGGEQGDLDDEEIQRRRMVAQLQELDRDESDSDSGSDTNEKSRKQTSKVPAEAHAHGGTRASASDASSDSSSDDDDDDEDETAALLRELEKIKRERAEEKARQERERAEMQQATREEEIALGNPLLNLENALRGGQQGGAGSTAGEGAGGFGVKRRWDDDVIFKNQAAGADGGDKGGFINDLTRSEFHKRFMQRYVK